MANTAATDLTAEIHARLQDNPQCPYRSGARENSPHVHVPLEQRPKVCSSVLEAIGNTPLVSVQRLCKADGVECEVLAKCEFFNAGGSVKDRIAVRMIEDAEKQGRIKPGDTLIEPTSGNTGIGMALAAAVKGYKMIITLPEKMSTEKVSVLKALGAEVVRTPTSAAWDSSESHIAVAMRLERELPNAHILDQYSNPSNPVAHYDGTAEEIIRDCDGKIDCIVVGAGTGGTITGIARKIKEKLPHVHIVGVDPHGSILAEPASLNTKQCSYQVEGTGYDFIPKVLDRQCVDEWVKSSDEESFAMARRLIREEGVLCGGSSGAAMHHALQIAKRYGKGQRVVVLLPDSIRNYLSKFVADDWMVQHGFLPKEPKEKTEEERFVAQFSVSDLQLAQPVTVLTTVTVEECIALLNKHNFDQMPVVDADGAVQGVVTLTNLTSQLLSGKTQASSPVSEVTYKQYCRVGPATPLDELTRVFERDHYALVVVDTQSAVGGDELVKRSTVLGVATQIDLLTFVMKQKKAQA